MMYKIVETWFGRFKVYEIATIWTDGGWVATFRRKDDAEQFVKRFNFKIEETQQPIF